MDDPIGFERDVSRISTTIDSLNYNHTRVKRTLGAAGIADTTKHKILTSPWTKFDQGACSSYGMGVLLVYATMGLDDP